MTKENDLRKRINEIFTENNEDDLDLELEDLLQDETEKSNYTNYGKNSNKNLVNNRKIEDVYKAMTVTFEEWKRSRSQTGIEPHENENEKEEKENETKNEQVNHEENKNEEKNESEASVNEELDEEEIESQEELTTDDKKGKKSDIGDDEVIGKTIELMDKEDQDYLGKIMKVKPNDIRKGKNVTDQKKIYESLIGIRIYLQNLITDINKFPQSEEIIQKIKEDENLSMIFENTTENMQNLNLNLLTLFKDLNLKGNLNDSLKDILKNFNLEKRLESLTTQIEQKDDFLESDDCFKLMDESLDKVLNISEKIVNIWYRKTLVYSNKQNNNKLLKVLNTNNFCEHVKKNVDEHYDSLRLKTKRKREKYRVIGKSLSSLVEEEDDNIYDDTDFYEFILKEFLSTQVDDQNNQNNENRADLTLQYLLNRRNKSKKTKKFDRNLSKDRILRYIQHERIVNFTTPIPNINENLGRNEIINSLFGGRFKKRVKTEDEMDNEVFDINII